MSLELAKTISDAPYRDAALGYIIELCMTANDLEASRILVPGIQSEPIREELVLAYPGLLPLISTIGIADLDLDQCVPRCHQALLAKGGVEQRMPLARYFSFVGGVLLALLFILDACFPKPPVAAKAKVYPPVIRIYSDRKWPERIVYDTSLPDDRSDLGRQLPKTSSRPPEIIAEASTGAKEREAFAMLPPSGERLQASNTKMRDLKPRHHGQNRQEARAGAQVRDGAPPANWLVRQNFW